MVTILSHKQYVEIQNINFETGLIQNVPLKRIRMSNSIPQDIVLGFILFLVYINDLPKITNNHYCTLYADDVSILFPCETTNELNNKLNIRFVKNMD